MDLLSVDMVDGVKWVHSTYITISKYKEPEEEPIGPYIPGKLGRSQQLTAHE